VRHQYLTKNNNEKLSHIDMFHFNLLETGEIWSGTEGGVIKAWPWDAIARSLSLTPEEKHMAALLVEQAYIDLRNHATVGNMSSLPTNDVKHMLADHCQAKVWTLTSMTFALWYAFVNTLHQFPQVRKSMALELILLICFR
jgi:hypothetical protein